MKDVYRFLAIDLGAESGRAVLGTLAGGRIALEEMHRFRTEGLFMLGTRQWDLARIYEEICVGITQCARKHGPELDGIGVDTWGVDFGLIAKDGTVLGNPVHYRDARTDGMMDHAFSIMPKAEIYLETGIQFMFFNTVFQLLSLVESESPLLDVADGLLLMGDLFGYLLSGQRACEYTNASTTQLLDPNTRQWNTRLINRLGLPRNLLYPLVPPGTVLGSILPGVAARTGISRETPIIAPATHDTGSAVAAVPVTADSGTWAYLSSGTWSLLGAELDEPCVNDATLEEQFTNEGGVDNKIRFLKNIVGLWLVQECRRIWEREGSTVDYAAITAEAAGSPAFGSGLVDVDDPRLMAPNNMVETIQEICRENGNAVPETRGAIIRCTLESLAYKYRANLRALDGLLDRRTDTLHIIGGGTQNKLLSQMTADACGIPVVTGPVEATALGNIGVQAMAVGALGSLEEMRKVIGNSFELERYEPKDTAPWDKISL